MQLVPSQQPAQVKKRHQSNGFIIGSVVLSIFLIGAVIIQSSLYPKPPNLSNLSTSTTLIASGTKYYEFCHFYNCGNGDHVSFSTSVYGIVTGAFTADGTTTVYLLTESQYQSLEIFEGEISAPKNFVYQANAVTATTTAIPFNTVLTAGNYTLLFFRIDYPYGDVTVTINQSFMFTPS